MAWYQEHVVEAGRAPAFWLLLGFLLTFAATRWVTRRIRAAEAAGKVSAGALSNVHIGGVHVHHQVWGILLALATGMLMFRFQPASPWAEVLAALFGAGAALALDEFALWLHLEDVYWSAEGRKSIDAILVTAVIAFGLLVGTSAVGVSPVEGSSWWTYVLALVVHFAAVMISALKGKRMSALIGIVIPLVAEVSAIRLAKPTSFWARRWYGDRKTARAHRRFSEDYQRRWNRIRDLVGGRHDKVRGGRVDRMVNRSLTHAVEDDA